MSGRLGFSRLLPSLESGLEIRGKISSDRSPVSPAFSDHPHCQAGYKYAGEGGHSFHSHPISEHRQSKKKRLLPRSTPGGERIVGSCCFVPGRAVGAA